MVVLLYFPIVRLDAGRLHQLYMNCNSNDMVIVTKTTIGALLCHPAAMSFSGIRFLSTDNKINNPVNVLPSGAFLYPLQMYHGNQLVIIVDNV